MIYKHKLENNREQNEFNMAISYLNRLNSILYSLDNAALELDAHAWYHNLRVLFRELSTEMKDDEIALWNQKGEQLNQAVIKQMNTNQRNQRIEIGQELYAELNTYELFLRRILKESGLQGKMKMDPRKALS